MSRKTIKEKSYYNFRENQCSNHTPLISILIINNIWTLPGGLSWNLGLRIFRRSVEFLLLDMELAGLDWVTLELETLFLGFTPPPTPVSWTLGVKLLVLCDGEPLELRVEVIRLLLFLAWRSPLEARTLVRAWRPRPDILNTGLPTQVYWGILKIKHRNIDIKVIELGPPKVKVFDLLEQI